MEILRFKTASMFAKIPVHFHYSSAERLMTLSLGKNARSDI